MEFMVLNWSCGIKEICNNLGMWRLRFLEVYNELYSKRVEFDCKAPTFVMKIYLVN
jgi:hypothetical protein